MPNTLVRDPVYKQLNEALRRLIHSGEFAVGTKFLSEREIGERFSVSRATANKALSTLVAEGVLAFKKGVGTFVHGAVRNYDWRSLVSFSERALVAGQVPSTRVLVAELISAAELDSDVVARLSLAPGEGAYYVERVRLADGQAMILERRYVAERACPKLLEHDLAASLYALWTERYGLEIGGATQAVRAVSATENEAELLGVASGAACLSVACLGHLASGAALWWEQALYRGDAYEFRTPSLEWSFLELARARESRPRRVKQA